MRLTDLLNKLKMIKTISAICGLAVFTSIVLVFVALSFIVFGIANPLFYIYVSFGILILTLIPLYIVARYKEKLQRIMKSGKGRVIRSQASINDASQPISIVNETVVDNYKIFKDEKGHQYHELIVRKTETDKIWLYPTCDVLEEDPIQVHYVLENEICLVETQDQKRCILTVEHIALDDPSPR